jgi:phage-related protein
MAEDSRIEVSFGAKTDELEEGIDRAKNAAQSFVAQIKDVSGTLSQMGDSASDAGKKLSAAISARQSARMAADDMRSEMQEANLAYETEMEHLKMSLATHEMTEDEKTAATIAAIQKRSDVQTAALDDQISKAHGNEVLLNHLVNERVEIENKADLAIAKAQDQATLKSIQEWKGAADQIASAFDSQLQKLLAGTEKWSQAMKNIAADLVLKMIEQQVKLTAEFLAEKARELAVHLATEAEKTGATEAGTTLRAAAEVASGQTSILETIANALKSIFASAAQTGAEVSAAVAPEAGPAAPAIGAGAMATVAAFASAGKFDVGTD